MTAKHHPDPRSRGGVRLRGGKFSLGPECIVHVACVRVLCLLTTLIGKPTALVPSPPSLPAARSVRAANERVRRLHMRRLHNASFAQCVVCTCVVCTVRRLHSAVRLRGGKFSLGPECIVHVACVRVLCLLTTLIGKPTALVPSPPSLPAARSVRAANERGSGSSELGQSLEP